MNGRYFVLERKLSAAYFARNNCLCLRLSSEADLLLPLFIPVCCLREHFYVEMSLIFRCQ